jgi:hypothetical protein
VVAEGDGKVGGRWTEGGKVHLALQQSNHVADSEGARIPLVIRNGTNSVARP